MNDALPPDLIAAITARIQDPARRGGVAPGEQVGVVSDPSELARMFEQITPGSSSAFENVVKQMEAWGQSLPPMHVTRNETGGLSASSEDANNYPIAPPATEAGFRELEQLIGRPLPAELRQLYAIADGGFGPGIGYTPGFGHGLYSLEGIGRNLEDLRRRGPDYCGTIEWPAHYLPLTDLTGAVAYDLDSGAIMAFNEYYENDGLTADQAWSEINPNLKAWLRDWAES